MSIGSFSWKTLLVSNVNYSQFVSMKIIAILVIFYYLAYQNNSNYVPLSIALYIYIVRAQINTITFLNHLGLSVSYDVLQKKLNNMTKLITM